MLLQANVCFRLHDGSTTTTDYENGMINSHRIVQDENVVNLTTIVDAHLEVAQRADVILYTRPLASGYSQEVHGEVTVQHKPSFWSGRSAAGEGPAVTFRCHSMHYVVKDNKVRFFAPGFASLR